MKFLRITFLCLLFATSLNAQQEIVNTFQQVEVILGDNKQIMPISLPEGTTSYFYAITVLPNKKKQPAQESLYSQVLREIDDQPLEQIAHRVVVPYKRKCSVNVILVQGEANAKGLQENAKYDYLEYFLNQESGATYVSAGPMEDIYIGIENRRIPRSYRVLVEVVAVVE